MNNKVLYITDHASSPKKRKNNKKSQQEQVTKKFSERKQAQVGMEPSKTNQTRCRG